jgi:hypothetical protein
MSDTYYFFDKKRENILYEKWVIYQSWANKFPK